MTTLPPIQIPLLDPTSRTDLIHRIETVSAEKLRQILKQTISVDSHNDFATTLHQILCIDFATAHSGAVFGEDTTAEEPSNNKNVADTEVVDLTDPDSDKENSRQAGKKRKAEDDDDIVETGANILKKVRPTNPYSLGPGLDFLAQNMDFRDRYKHCVNCYALYDIMSEPCHQHIQGPKRTPGPRERCGIAEPEDDSSEEGANEDDNRDEDEDDESEEEDYCECFYHSGILDLDEDNVDDWFVDHDENCHGTIDSEDMRLDRPEAFVWSCCDQNGKAEGCKMSRHQIGGGLLECAKLKMRRG